MQHETEEKNLKKKKWKPPQWAVGHLHAAFCLVTGIPQGEQKDRGEAEKQLEKQWLNFPNLVKTVSTHI